MSRYIDAEVLDDIVDELNRNGYDISNTTLVRGKIILSHIPTADVIPIEWIKEQKDKCFPYSITALALNGLITEWERREDGEIH